MNVAGEGDARSDKAVNRERRDHTSTETDKRERDIKEEKDVQMDGEEKDSGEEGDKDLDVMQRLPHKRKSARRADELIRKQSLGGEGEAAGGASAPVVSGEEKKVPKGIKLLEGITLKYHPFNFHDGLGQPHLEQLYVLFKQRCINPSLFFQGWLTGVSWLTKKISGMF
jgi:hypothetical protein